MVVSIIIIIIIIILNYYIIIYIIIIYLNGANNLEHVTKRSSPLRRTQPSPFPRCNQGNYVNRLGSQLTDSLRVLYLELGVTRQEVNVRNRFLARRLHYDKHDPDVTGMTSEEAVELFKRVNNAQQIIRDSM